MASKRKAGILNGEERTSPSDSDTEEIQIYVKNQTGKTVTVKVLPIFSIYKVKELITDVSEIPPDIQCLIFSGKLLQNDQKVMDYNIKNESTIHLLRTRGRTRAGRGTGREIISTFSDYDVSDPTIRFLMMSDSEREDADVPLDDLNKKAKEKGANPFMTFCFDRSYQLLSSEHIALLNRFLDFLWSATRGSTCRDQDCGDMRACLSDDLFLHLMQSVDKLVEPSIVAERLLVQLKKVAEKVPGASENMQIALRMSRGPTNSCVDFHCDGHYAASTSQISLNSHTEYEGGKLCFFVNDRVEFLSRPIGSLVQHPPDVLHAVTNLTSGTMKSLFVVDQRDRLGGFCEVTVNAFLNSKISS